MSKNPRTGAAWTVTELNAGLELGFEIYPTPGAWNYITQTWVEVRYRPPSAPTVSTVYRYDKLGHLTGVTDAAGNVTSVGYDLGGRKTSMSDPDMGSWSYGYNVASSLTSQTDARGVTTTLGYDALERLTGKTYSNGDPAVSFLYDSYPDSSLCPQANTAIGMMTRMTDGAGKQYACFDVRGRAVTTRRSVGGLNYDMSTTYDALNQPVDVTYPDGEVVHNATYVQGQLSGVTSTTYGETFAGSIVYKPTHQLESFVLGTVGPTTTFTYDYRARLTNVTSGTLQNTTLTYDDAGNVTGQADATTGESVAYSYDALNRLIGASGFSGGATAAYTYNSIGNLLTKQEGSSNLTLNYPAAGQPRPHAVTGTTGTQTLSLAYDANGNLATQGASTYGFDAENRLKSRTVTGGTTTYTYDGNGAELKRTNADGSWTVYIAGVYEKNSDGSSVKYYAAGGRLVAVRRVPSGGGAGTLYYLLQDHLGGTAGLVDTSGALVAGTKTTYWPYGATRGGAVTQTDKLYTGQRQEPGDAALGLYNYKARFYSTTLGRFASADPVVSGMYNPQSWNGYSYVGNNPLVRTDPTGERWCDTDTCDPASSASMTYHGSNVGSGCSTACQWIAAWNAFHPGGCWSCVSVAPAPARIDPGLAMLAAAGLTSPALVQQALASARAPVMSQLPICPGPSCGYPIPGAGDGLWEVIATGAGAASRLMGSSVAVPVGLALLGLIVSPCDTQYCTRSYDPPALRPGWSPPANPDERPAPGFERIGRNWFNPKTGETLSPDFGNPAHDPHYDYGRREGKERYRVYPDGRWEPK